MARPRHPNKEIEAAVAYAESRGWVYVRAGGHAWGLMYCPERSRAGHRLSVHSTPRNPYSHAEKVRKSVDDCQHGRQ